MIEIHGSLEQCVSFGDCDPTGIVFYPHFYAWFDRTFHALLARFGGHSTLCGQLGAKGVGLIEASARFHRPLQDGDRIRIDLVVKEWGEKTVSLGYEVWKGDVLCATGAEVRGLFKETDTGMIAASIAPLKRALEADG
ncbi:acyl-CoA thioesterase [Rhizobium rhizogenes]|uniref:4-hydroxylbenzoyl-CoA Thioesterase n=1 Tax=Rhizobium rhizogenes (strain K84 / ATCC BAA-868) TaxID=311403 RepID=B9JM36_RHIR8|nr:MULTISPECIES: acyl-CoA thioesterase [Rhizobium]ACM28750.1 4-hydroxylbenzoyl-CoA Thioesterase [Rhizobium rhizogenes K84]OCJ18985.1 4-hydroxybenzoyl-CoA thioesterase [Agrobacterium sp. B131/95]EJK88046.1 putative thioesterase [Rhizobium sp. AP16]NTI24422.1 acyl-CoA thioesterase [Rhizobium rhizogenes]NTI43742.1 acyl-CoA thioesterase [Rhizobium rhizogenes]